MYLVEVLTLIGAESPHNHAAKNGKGKSAKNSNGVNLGFEVTLWQAADKMRGHMDAAEYKHVALGLIFLKYISDAFAERHRQLLAEVAQGADPEDRDEYRAENVFWVPKEARWEFCRRMRSSRPSAHYWTMR